MAIELKTYNDILGALVRKIIADTSINDLNRGSVLLTLLEAIATQDFDNNVAILSVLETLSIDAIRNSDLDQRAADYGITRIPASKATGFVKIGDSSITKRSTTLYAVKPAPIAGSTVIYVNDASTWINTGGQLFIGRGTQQFEGPVTYTNIVNNGSFYTITLASSLQKDHLISDSVIDAQDKTDRVISANTSIIIPANNVRPETVYMTLRDAVLAAGEDSISNIPIVAEKVGSSSNTGIDTIVKFVSPPFTSATVSNTSALIDGRDAETDTQLRERVKNYATTLARGTRASILSSIVGVSDSDDGKQVASAMITEPPVIGDPAIIYLDDGTGFQPSYKGQAVDILLNSANGDEEFLQLANYPLPRPQIINQVEGPVELSNNMVLSVLVDGVLDEVTFKTTQFVNITSATFSEIVVAINEKATLFKCRLTDNSSRLLLYPASHTAEKIQVQGVGLGEDTTYYTNGILKFPTVEYSYISLYRNNEKLNEKAKFAFVISNFFSSWGITDPGNLIIEVDGTPPQDRGFSTVDFGGKPLAAVTLPEWAEVFVKKFAGINVSATATDKLLINSNRIGSESLLRIVGGTYFNQMFGGLDVSSQGQNSSFELNRQTGNIRLTFKPNKGDTITAGAADTKGNSISSETTTGYFNLSADTSQREAQVVFVTDGTDVAPRLDASPVPGNAIRVETVDTETMRIVVDVPTIFDAVQINDYIFIPYKAGSSFWFSQNNTSMFKVKAKGPHTDGDVDTYVDVTNIGSSTEGPFVFVDSVDLQVFKANTYPQIWKGSYLPIPISVSLQDIIVSMKKNLLNVQPTIYRTNSLKVTSTTENNGSICIPISSGRASVIFDTLQENQFGNLSHIAAKQISKDLVSTFKRTQPYTNNVFLNRYVYSSVKDVLDVGVKPQTSQTSLYNEEVTAAGTFNTSSIHADEFIAFTSGANKGHFRSIKEFLSGDSIRTQFEAPKTIFDHAQGDQFEVIEPLSISPTDSIVFVMDGDPITKTININMWRSGRVNNQYVPSSTSFSADDADNEAGKTFGDLQIWSKELTSAEFKDYAVAFRSRNWYRTGGALSSGATIIIRAKEYGLSGNQHRFRIEYPTLPNQVAKVSHANTPEKSLTTFIFASGAERVAGIVGGTSFKVTSLGSNLYRYAFQEAGVDLATVVPGDILSLSDSSGVTTANKGTFSIVAKDNGLKTLDVYNPNGAVTNLGLPEISNVTCIADVVGSPAEHTIDCTQEGSGINEIGLNEYFILNDDLGGVGFWYDINNTGAPNPTIPGVYRYIKIPTVITGYTADQVASATTSIINSDSKFTATVLLNQITVTNNFNGDVSTGTAGPNTGFTVTKTVVGVADDSIGGRFFKIYDQNGSVAIWFNVNSDSEPTHGCLRSIQVIIAPGSSADTVASTIATELDADSQFIASSLTDTVTITDAYNGVRSDLTANTSGFTVSVFQNGIDPAVERINFTSGCRIFPLESNDAQSVADKISTSQTLIAVPVGDTGLMFTKATREETYTYVDNTTALSYGHNPDPLSGLHNTIGLYDGESYVKIFENTSPQFVLKTPLLLNGIVPAIYAMNTCPNQDSTDLGEFFRLVPKTINNVKHHFSHKALSQLSIIADIEVSSNFRRVQVKSKKLGTAGSVEVVGGRANIGEFSIFGDAQVTPYNGVDYIETKVSAYPATINNNEVVRIYNNKPAKRIPRFLDSDTVNVVAGVDADFEYRLNPKAIYSTPYVKWTITDHSADYSLTPGIVWRWQHSAGGANVDIQSIVNTTVPTPVDYNGVSIPDALNLYVFNHTNGNGTSKSNFSLTVSDVPQQGDYFFFEVTTPTTASFAVWFGVDGDTTPPTGTPFSLATNQIIVPILSTDTPNAITVKLWGELTSDPVFTGLFASEVSNETNLGDVREGDTLFAAGIDVSIWPINNQVKSTGDSKFAGFPVVKVDTINKYVEVVNPFGVAMLTPTLPIGGTVNITPSYGHQWRLKHNAMSTIYSIIVTGGTNCLVMTTNEHNLTVGTSIDITEAGSTSLDGTFTITSVPSVNTFTMALSSPISNLTYFGGRLIVSGSLETRYKLEKIGFNDLYRLARTTGSSPYFVDCGVAVDDFVVISGTTFKTVNNGRYRILAVDNDSMIVKSAALTEEIHSYKLFNERGETVSWVSNSAFVTGTPSAFKNVTIGSWIKKREDADEMYAQVIDIAISTPTEWVITLGAAYKGVVSESEGIVFDQINDIDMGVYLKNTDDIRIYEGDSVVVNDQLIVENNSVYGWFNTANSGVHTVTTVGTSVDNKPFVRIKNGNGLGELNRTLLPNVNGFYVLESTDNLYESYRVISHSAINQFNTQQRTIFLTPATCVHKMGQQFGTKIESQGKLGFEVNISTGIDGYTYYTGLMRTVQRIIDGYEPDPTNYPGKRAVGSSIELLPPLLKSVAITINITTHEGINLTDISNDIKSTIINYINTLGVGEDVIMSEIIARVMGINGIQAATFTSPSASTERITVTDDQKALITPEQISLS